MESGLDGSHVFITGASGGIGLATAEYFLGLGSKVTLHCNTARGALDALAEEENAKHDDPVAHVVQADCTQEDAVQRAMDEAAGALGPVHVLIINHAIYRSADISVRDMTLDQWRETMSINLDGSFLFARSFLRQVTSDLTHVSIVLIGSTAGLFDYACTKSAMMHGLLLSLKNEIVWLHPRGRVNCVAPGWVRTPMASEALKSRAIVTQALSSTPLKKVAEPIDIARACAFLCSPVLSGHVTGHVLHVNGGMEGRKLNESSDIPFPV